LFPDDRSQGIDPEFLPFVQSFERRWGKTVDDIPVNFGNVQDKGTAAACFYQLDGRREIVVSKYYWEHFKVAAPRSLEFIIWHELGHCVLLRKHTHSTMTYQNKTIPTSLMFPSVFYHQLDELKEYYTEELFNPKNGRHFQ
jgi:hypothetical protein